LFYAPCQFSQPSKTITHWGFYLAVASRTVNANDGTGPHTWNYSGWSTTGSAVKVTDPVANDSLHVMTGLGGTGSLYETQTQTFQGSSSGGTLLQTVTTDYSWINNPFYPKPQQSCNNVFSVVPIRVTTAWPNGQTTKEETDYDPGFSFYAYSSSTSYSGTATYGRVTAKREYDYGSGGPGPLLRQTATSYIWQSNSTYLADNFLAYPSSVQVLDGSSVQRAYTVYNYDQYALAPSGTSTQHDPAPPDGAYRANHTSKARWLNGSVSSTANCSISVSNGYLYTYSLFFDTGTVQKATDSCGSSAGDPNHTTTYAYSSNYAGAWPTSITNALNQSTSQTFDFDTGVLTSRTDPNNQTTSFQYDIMSRPTQVNYADGGQTTYCYPDLGGSTCTQSSPPYTAVTTRKINSSQNETTTTLTDGLGRTVQTQLTSDPQGTVYADTTYDGLGRVWKRSNPYRSGSASTDGTTTYIYDALGRTCVLVPPDGTAITNNTCPATNPGNDVLTLYSGNTTTVTDEYGIKRQSVTDGLGRLTQVFEDPGGLNYETDYAYDALDNLLCAAQKGTNSATFANCASTPAAWRPRTFTYDSLSRLLSATNPESGNITYSYDANGNLVTKTAPAPNQTGSAAVTTTYSYDAVNRLTQKSYSDGATPAPTPTAYFLYDLVNPWGSTYPNNYYVGRLDETITKNSSGTWLSSSYFLHDQMGRVTKIGQCTPTNCGGTGFHTVYAYDLVGDLTSFRTIENNITFSYQYNAAVRPTKVTSSLSDANHPATLATVNSSIGYWAFGGLHMLSLGNGVTETGVYNSRLQPCRMNVNSSGAWYNQCTDAIATGNVQDFTYGFSLGSSDNGNLTSFSATGARTFSRTYSYGQLNRLSSMSAPSDPSGCTGLSWTYDSWGNRSDQTVTSRHIRQLFHRDRLLCLRCRRQSRSKNRRISRNPVCFGYSGPSNSRGRRQRKFHDLLHFLCREAPCAIQKLYDAVHPQRSSRFHTPCHRHDESLIPRRRSRLPTLWRTAFRRHVHHPQIYRQRTG